MFQYVLLVLVLLIQEPPLMANETRIKCPIGEVGLQCSFGCRYVGLCDINLQLHLQYECKSDEICENGACRPSSPSDVCQYKPEQEIICLGTHTTVPDLLDCTMYYNCQTGSSNGAADLEFCPSGNFDPCSGNCTSTASCATYVSCDLLEEGKIGIVSENSKLAYMCMKDDNGNYITYWLAPCENGAYKEVDDKVSCDESVTYSCADNGNGGDDGPTCASPGKYAFANTNCKYRECYGDGSHRDITCLSGYHYDATAKKCVMGTCI